MRGHYETAKLLLDHGADPNAADRKRNTPLHHTAFHGYTKVANLLLDKGAAPNLVNVFGQTALDRATQGRGGDTMRRLLEEFGGVYMQGEGGKKKKRGKKDGEIAPDVGAAPGVATAGVPTAGSSASAAGGVAVMGAASGVAKKKNEKGQKEPTGNCRFEKGKCPFGPKCRFSHGSTTSVAAAIVENQLRHKKNFFSFFFFKKKTGILPAAMCLLGRLGLQLRMDRKELTRRAMQTSPRVLVLFLLLLLLLL